MIVKEIKRALKKYTYLIYPIYYKKTIWLIGSGRSGTTWVASMINYKKTYRELFEPFHTCISEMNLIGFKKNLFLDDKVKQRGFRTLSKTIMNGKFYHPRIEKDNEFIKSYQNDFLLVKDIFANLCSYEICSKNKKIKPILLIRNPFATVSSIREREDWDWMEDPKEFLLQKRLREVYLLPFESLILDISKNGSYFEKQVLIWSIINYIPLVMFNEKELLVTFYEDWVSSPNNELKRVNKYLSIDTFLIEDIRNHINFQSASKTSTQKKFNTLSWKNKISGSEFNSGMEILNHFGFDKLYDEFSLPNHELLKQILSKKNEYTYV